MEPNKSLQTIVLKTLIRNEPFCRKALPHIKAEYFDITHRGVYDIFLKFITKFNRLPTASILDIEFQESDWARRAERNEILGLIHSLAVDDVVDSDWLLDATEKWCKERALYIAIMESFAIIDGKRPEAAVGSIPDMLEKALGVSFDTNVGHDYIEDSIERYAFYHRKEDKIPFGIEMLNVITKGGVVKKTLNILLAGTGVGKSLAMCHLASDALSQGRNVLYITMEMSEEKIAERIDANLLDVDISLLDQLPADVFSGRIAKLAGKTKGRLIVKEYPTASAHVGHFRALLNELKMKKSFAPDVIFIDYLNICASSRMKGLSSSVNTYSFIKAIAEEIRGLAVEYDVPIWSATQVTRTGFGNTDVEITDTSESFGLPATADLMLALISTEKLESMNQLMIKQLKNRYNDATKNTRFVVGIDRSKMRLYDVENSAQTLTSEGSQQAPSSPVVRKAFEKPGKGAFTGFKV